MNRNLFFIFLILSGCINIISSCENNCFLGGGFFSVPVDIKGCCRYDLRDEHCEYYTQLLNNVVCFRCKIGYEWSNNECVPFTHSEETAGSI